MIKKNVNFWNDELPTGYYDKIFSDGAKKNNGVRSSYAIFCLRRKLKRWEIPPEK